MHQPENHDLYRFLTAGNGIINVGPYGFPSQYSSCDQFPGGMPPSFCETSYYPLDVSGLMSDTPPQDRALAALKNHKEAEKRRRERINSHLDKLRGLLPCNSKVISQFILCSSFFSKIINMYHEFCFYVF